MPTHPLITTLRTARRTARRSQLSVTTHAGFGERSIGYWENGKVDPSLPNFVAWANALDIEVVLIPRPRK